MTVHIDLAKAKALVEECIAERGEKHVYEKEGSTCKYVHNVGQVMGENEFEYEDDFSEAVPGCIVGLALSKAGVPLEFMGGSRNMDGSNDLLDAAQRHGHLTYTDQAEAFLGNCQASQDGGAEWGEAAKQAALGNQLDKEYNYSNYVDGEPEFVGFRVIPGAPIE
jgi:hypothetical protein